MIRPGDLLQLDFQFENLELKTPVFGKRYLKPADPTRPSTITVYFPPQNISEEAFYEQLAKIPLDYAHFPVPEIDSLPLTPEKKREEKKKREPDLPPLANPQQIKGSELISSLPIQARIAEPSRLVFIIPPGIDRIPLTLESLLGWNQWTPKVHPTALSAYDASCVLGQSGCTPSAHPQICPPGESRCSPDGYTSIEAPYRLMLSPHAKSAWAHLVEVDHKTRFTELWHTRLAIRKDTGEIDEDNAQDRTLRAIWSPDFRRKDDPWPEHFCSDLPPASRPEPFRSSLDNQDRHELVHLTSNYDISIPKKCAIPSTEPQCVAHPETCEPYVPGAVEAEQFMLSSMGSWLKSRGVWEPPAVDFAAGKILTVEAWRHIATMGRDHYVRVVYKGYLMPFGHRASLIKVTERKVENNKDGVRGAFLKQRMYIVVRQFKKEFPAFGQPFDGRQFPWRLVEALTQVTPTLDDPNQTGTQSRFWPRVAGIPFDFRFRLWDVDGRSSEIPAPVLFVDNSVAFNPLQINDAIKEYNTRQFPVIVNGVSQSMLARDLDARGQKISLAASSQPGDTQYDTQRIKIIAERPGAITDLQCLYVKGQPFFYPEIETANINPEAVRRIRNNNDGATVKYVNDYLRAGFDPAVNRGEVFLETVGDALNLSFGKSGAGESGKADQAGGVVTPNMGIIGFSRKNGAVGGGGRPSPPPLLLLEGNDWPAIRTLQPGADLTVRQKGRNLTAGKMLEVSDQSLTVERNGRAVPIRRESITDVMVSANVSAVAKVQKGEFDPLDYFGGALQKAKILGGITLWDILKPIAAGALSNLSKAPKMVEETLFPAIQNLTAVERQIVSLLDRLPNVATRTFGAEINEVRESFANVTSQVNDPIGEARAQARFIRAITRLLDRMASVVENPNALLDAALKGLLPAVTEFEQKLIATAQQSAAQWQALHARELAQIENQLVSLLLNGILYEEQIRNYIETVQNDVKQLRSEVQTLIDLSQDPAGMLKVLGPFLAAEIPQLARLENVRRRLLTLVRMAEARSESLKKQLRDAITTVETFATVAQADADTKIQNFETECLRWIATLPEEPMGKIQITRRIAQQLVRQAVTAIRKANESTKIDKEIHRQVLNALQQLQSAVVDTPSLRVVAPPPPAALIKSINELARLFTVVKQAIDADGLENKLSAVFALLPAELRNELTATLVPIKQALDSTRNQITQPTGDIELRLVTYQLQLFDLWLKYQDPFRLAADVFALEPDDIAKLKKLRDQYNAIVVLAAQVKNGLTTLTAAYNTFLGLLPQAAKDLLANATSEAKTALDAVMAAAEEDLLRAEQRAISAVANLYLELLRRIQQPLAELTRLLQAKDELEALVRELAIPQSVTLSYEWKPELKSHEPVFTIEKDSQLTVKARLTTYLKEVRDPEFSIDGALTNFSVKLIGNTSFITVQFAHFKFSSRNGSKPDVQVRIKDVKLSQQLGFVSKLQQLLSPSDKDGPFIELNFLGIRAGYRFGIPAITVGAFNLYHLKLIVAVNLPFTGEPMRSEFSLSERHHPFLLSAGQYGGGGFLRMRLGLDGVELIEGALEFGVVAAISIGIASGSGFVMAGIYFSVERTESKVCGFVHANGHMDIIGLISVDIDVLVQICYRSGGNVEGEAQVIIHIEYCFFSIDIELHAHYQFAGSPREQNLEADNLTRGMLAQNCDDSELEDSPAPFAFCDMSASDFAAYRRAFVW